MPIKCRIWWDNDAQAYLVNCAYDPKFIDALKALIPSGDRNIDWNTKTWYVAEKYGLMIQSLAQSAFTPSAVSFTSKEVTQQAKSYGQQKASQQGAYLNTASGTTEDAMLAFMNLIPYEGMKKAYLAAAQTLHPDKQNGDGTKMAKLNELWSRIEKEFFKR